MIGQDGKQVLLKNGGFIVKTHPSKVVLRATAITQLDSKATAVNLEQVPQTVQDVDRRPRRNNIDPQQWSVPDDLSEDEQSRSKRDIALPIPQLNAEESEAMPAYILNFIVITTIKFNIVLLNIVLLKKL